MLQLIRFLIFGKQCAHDWQLLESMEPFSNHCLYLYKCSKCGKMKKQRMKIAYYGN